MQLSDAGTVGDPIIKTLCDGGSRPHRRHPGDDDLPVGDRNGLRVANVWGVFPWSPQTTKLHFAHRLVGIHSLAYCAIKNACTTGKERRITRWEHERVLEAVQRRLDEHPEKMRLRRETVEHPFGTIKARMGATHFLMKTLPRVATEMALHVLAYNLTRVINTIGIQPLMAAMRA